MARQNLTKALALLLAVMMLIGLTACAKTPASSTTPTESKSEQTSSAEEKPYYNKTGYPICDTPIQLTAAAKQPSMSDKNHQWSGHADASVVDQLAYYKNELGLDISLDTYIEDDWSTQLTMMLSINKIPDMVWHTKLTVPEANKYGRDAFFADIAQYKDIMPNFKAYCEAYPELEKYLTTSDGKIYTTVVTNQTDVENSLRYWLNRKWLDRLNAEVPTTVEDFYKLLIRFRDEDPNGDGVKNDIPLDYSSMSQMFTNRLLQNAFGVLTTEVDLPVHVNNGKTAIMDDNYKEMIRFLCRLYNEGLMDKDSFSVDEDSVKAKVGSDMVGAYAAYAPFLCYPGTSYPDDAKNAAGMMSLSSEYNGNKQIACVVSSLDTYGKFMISANTKYPEACARLMDFLYTTEGRLLGNNGQMGVHVQLKEDKILGIMVNDMVDPPANENYESKESWRTSKVVLNNTLSVAGAKIPGDTSMTYHDAIWKFAQNDTPEHWQEVQDENGWQALCLKSVADNKTEIVSSYPTMVYPDEKIDERARLIADLTNTLKEGRSSLILGKMEDFDAGWDKLVKDMEGAGMADLLKIEQDAYDNYTKK